METPFEFNPVYKVTPEQQKRLPHLILPESKEVVLDLDQYFGRKAPLEIDIGSGKGRFVVERAAAYPDHNFLAIERRLGRVNNIQSKLVHNKIENVRILRVEAAHTIMHMIPDGAIHTCYIFFPDPWPKRRHRARRLFSPEFQTALWEKMATKGRLNFATDQMPYFAQVDPSLEQDERFERTDAFITAEHERSEFEQLFLRRGDPIGRCSFIKVT